MKDLKFKVSDYVKILKYKNTFAKSYVPNWSQKAFMIKNVIKTVSWKYVISDLNGEEIVWKFYEKYCQRRNQKEFRFKKVIKREGDKLYVKWKGYNSFFNTWNDKNDLCK